MTNCNNLRKDIIDMSFKNNSGHIPSSLSMVDYLYWLFKENYVDITKDRLVIGKPFGAQAYYSVYADLGYIPKEDLANFGSTDHYLSHGVTTKLPGVVFSEDTLGSCLGVACGIALSLKNIKSDKKVYVNVSDGSLQAGTIWEAIMFAETYNLSNIFLTVDYNKLQILNELQGLDNLADKFKSFGWETYESDGHTKDKITKSLDNLFYNRPMKKPGVLIFDTVKGKGITFMENNLEWHYKTLDKETYDKCKVELL